MRCDHCDDRRRSLGGQRGIHGRMRMVTCSVTRARHSACGESRRLVGVIVQLVVQARNDMRIRVLGRSVRFRFVLVGMAVRQRRRRGGEARGESEHKPEEAQGPGTRHAVKLAVGGTLWNPAALNVGANEREGTRR